MLCILEMSEMVFTAFTQMHTDTQCTAYMPLAPPRGSAPFKKSPVLWVYWFTTMQSEEATLLTFLDLSNYKGDCRQDAQPIPNS